MAVFFLLALAGCVGEDRTPPVAHQGVLDLTGWDPDRDGPIKLNGEWAFYQDKLLDPAALAGTAPDKTEDFLALPASWNGETAAGKDIGTVLATSGTLGTDARSEVPEPSLRLPSWQADGRPLDIGSGAATGRVGPARERGKRRGHHLHQTDRERSPARGSTRSWSSRGGATRPMRCA